MDGRKGAMQDMRDRLKVIDAVHLNEHLPKERYCNNRKHALLLVFIVALSLLAYFANIYKLAFDWAPPAFFLAIAIGPAVWAMIKESNYRTYWRDRVTRPASAVIEWEDDSKQAVRVSLKPYHVDLNYDYDGHHRLVVSLGHYPTAYWLMPYSNGETRGWRSASLPPLRLVYQANQGLRIVMVGAPEGSVSFEPANYLSLLEMCHRSGDYDLLNCEPHALVQVLLETTINAHHTRAKLAAVIGELSSKRDALVALVVLALDIISDRETVSRSSLTKEWRVQIATRLGEILTPILGDNVARVLQRAQSRERNVTRLFSGLDEVGTGQVRSRLLEGNLSNGLDGIPKE